MEAIDSFLQERGEVFEVLRGGEVLCDVENLFLCSIEDVFQLASFIEAEVRDEFRSLDELAHHSFLPHYLGIVFDVGRGGDGGGELGEEGGAADSLKKFLLLQARGEREQVDRLVLGKELEHRVVDGTMLLEVEGGRRNDIHHLVDGIWAEHDRTEQGHLSVEVVRRDADLKLGQGRLVHYP